MAAMDTSKNSFSNVVAYGMRLGTTLQTFVETSREGKEILQEILFETHGTTSILARLDETLQSDEQASEKQGRLPTYKPGGVVEIEKLAGQCANVYRLVVGLLQRASERTGRVKDDNAVHKPLHVDMDPGSLRILPILQSLEHLDVEDWLDPRLARCCEQLRWLKSALILHLQLAGLANIQLDQDLRRTGAFDAELGFRATAERIRARQLKIAKRAVKRQNDKETERQDDEESEDEPVQIKPTKGLKVGKTAPALDGPETTSILLGGAETLKLSTAAPVLEKLTLDTPAVSTESSPAPITELPSSDTPEPKEIVEGIPAPFVEKPAPPSVLVTPTNTTLRGPRPLAGNIAPNLPMPVQPNWKGSFGPLPTSANHSVPPPPPYKDGEDDFVVVEKPDEETVAQIATAAPEQSRVFNFVPKWVQAVFGSSSPNMNIAAANLEAYIADAARSSSPTKVPLEPGRLRQGLDSIRKNKSGSAWLHYMDMGPKQRGIVDDVVAFAKGQSAHARTCVGVEEHVREGQPTEYLVFLALSEPPRPVVLKDCLGRVFSLPFEACKEWDGMKSLIDKAFRQVEAVGEPVLSGYFDLLGPQGHIILPSLWSATVRPGDKIVMHLWPMTKPPPHRIGRPLPRPPPGSRPLGLGGPSGGLPPPPPPPSGPGMLSGGGSMPRKMAAPPPHPSRGLMSAAPPPPPPGPGFPLARGQRFAGGIRPMPPREPEIIEVVPPKPVRPEVSKARAEVEKNDKDKDKKDKKKSLKTVLEWMTGPVDKYKLSKEEEEELAIVDFKAFLDARMNVADMLVRWTNATDVQSDVSRFWGSGVDTSDTDSSKDSDSDSDDSL